MKDEFINKKPIEVGDYEYKGGEGWVKSERVTVLKNGEVLCIKFHNEMLPNSRFIEMKDIPITGLWKRIV